MDEKVSGWGWKRGPRFHTLMLLLYTALGAIYTYPLIFNLDRVNGTGDPAVMVWSMAWIVRALSTDPLSLYEANIFHPTENVLAYTDILLPSALLTAPFYLITGNALIGFNVVLLLTYTLSGYATFLLVSRLLRGKSYALHAAIFAGAIYALCPYRLGHITQLNSMTTYWLPLILLFMHRYLEDGRRFKALTLVGLFFTLNALSGLYYGVFAALMMAAFYVLWALLNSEAPKARDFAQGIPIFAAFAMILALLLGPYLALSGDGDHGRSVEMAATGSLVPAALLTSPPESLLFGWTPEFFNLTSEHNKPLYELTLYPGLVVAALASYAVISRSAERKTALYASLGVAIFLLSLGPFFAIGEIRIPLPYYLLYEYVPGFGNLRVPARMWSVVMLCLAILGAFGLRSLLEKISARSGSQKAIALFVGLSIISAVEYAPVLPFDRYQDRGPAELEPAYAYLAANAGGWPEDAGAIVAEVPFATENEPFRETPRMYRSTHGWWRLVNGYASYFPEGYTETANTLNSFPSEESLAKLRELGVEYVVVHPIDYAKEGADGEAILRAADTESSLQRVAGDGKAALYRIEAQ